MVKKETQVSIYYRQDRQKWVVDAVWPDGKRTRRIMPNLPTAKKIWKKISTAIVDEDSVWMGLRQRLRLDPGTKQDGITFYELADIYYTDYCVSNNRDAQSKAYRLGTIRRHIADMPVEHVTLRHVDKFISARQKEGVTNNTINLELSTLKHMYKWAQRRYIGVNKLDGIELLEKVEWEGERPNEDVIDRIFAHLPPEYIPIFTFIRETGCRNSEATSVKWNQLNLYDDSVRFSGKDTKNGKSRSVPLTAETMAAISATPRLGMKIFSRRTDTFDQWNRLTLGDVWRKARAKVMDINGNPTQLRIHDLRHAYAIKLAERGCAMHFICEVLGHHSIEFTRKHYARFTPESANRAVLQFLNKKSEIYAPIAAPAY